MAYEATFKGWDQVTLEDLVVAYRKAKADCYFESTFPTAIQFARYEQDLLKNLKRLLVDLKKGKLDTGEWLGKYRLLPKKLAIKAKGGLPTSHIHFSNPERAFSNLIRQNDLVPEFRIIGDFPVNAHIISALWVNTIGEKFDACLTERCYGARLRRIKGEGISGDDVGKFHLSAIGSFRPYFQPYQEWRRDGLCAIRGELEKDRDVIAVSLDLKSYYHFIDPRVITSKKLLTLLGIKLTKRELDFTKAIAEFLEQWADGAKKFAKKVVKNSQAIPGGLVIGLTATRIISNVLLYEWDRLIQEKLTPIHYGRYVDDMFIVLRDPGTIEAADQFMLYLQTRLGHKKLFKEEAASIGKGKTNGALWRINLGQDLQLSTKLGIQEDKQKLFILHGRAGLDLLDSIEKEIRELSSEHRLMPSPDELEDSTAARVLSATSNAGEQADTLRRADGLTIRRLSWSLQLRHVETLGRDLPKEEWARQRHEFYQFAHNHILRPDSVFVTCVRTL